MLASALANRSDVHVVQTVRAESGRLRAAIRAFTNIRRLAWGVLTLQRGGSVLMFASSGASFWEKLAWAAVVMALGRKAAVVMVDGHFPRVFANTSAARQAVGRWMVSRPACTIGAQSASWSEYYRLQFPSARIREVLAGVDRDFFLERRSHRDGDLRGIGLLYVGWIVEEKGVADLLDALQLLPPAASRDLSVRLVGPAFGRESFWTNEVARRGLSNVVHLVGPVMDRVALLGEYERADVFVFPSHFEGFPVALVEAAAAGLACVGTDVGGIPDILDHGRAGVVVPAHAPSALANAIAQLVADAGGRMTLAAAAAHRARELYTPEQCVASYLRLMEIQ